MANETLSFLCPACGIKLTVPGQLAGVVGPCPTCRTTIQAPFPAHISSPVDQSPPAREALPVYQAPPVAAQDYPAANNSIGYLPATAFPSQQPPPVYPAPPSYASAAAHTVDPRPQVAAAAYEPITAPLPVAASPVYQAPPVPAAGDVDSLSVPAPGVLRPEPRQLPSRSNPAELVAKPMPEPSYRGNSSKNSRSMPKSSHRRRYPFARFLLLFSFLIASGAIVFGVLTVLKNQSKADSPRSQAAAVPTRKILPEESIPTRATEFPVEDDSRSLPVPVPQQPSVIEAIPTLPEGLEPKTPSDAAREVLDQFLAAKTLAERLPLIETRTPPEELATSCLAGPLPAASNVLIDAMENNPVEQVADLYHSVDFDIGNNRTTPQVILVRTRGSAEPKVVVDPFLDSYGGRLAAYAQTPSEKSGIFQVIIWPLASCYDDRIPNHEKKLTLKLLPRDNAKEIALAYFGRQSKIAQMLEDGTYSLSYGKAKACTVMLRWNVEDRAETPYLEAIDLKTLDWNP